MSIHNEMSSMYTIKSQKQSAFKAEIQKLIDFFQQNCLKSLVIGDDGGDTALIYLDGKDGCGLYKVGFGDLNINEAVKISSSLRDLLVNNTGIANFKWD